MKVIILRSLLLAKGKPAITTRASAEEKSAAVRKCI